MSKVYFWPNGTPSPVPVSRSHAIECRAPRYDSGEKCEVCSVASVRYTKNDKCVHCARIEAMHFYNYAIGASELVELNLFFKRDNLMSPISADLRDRIVEARPLLGESPATGRHDGNWLQTNPCKDRGHFGIRTAGGKCYFCEAMPVEESPRQKAIAKGEKWYTPDKPCKRCNTTAERHVDNGRCRGCGNTAGTRTPAEAALPPSMMLSKADALAYGFTVYRTGKECKNGHTGFRYTSTGNCIECRKEGA